MQGADRVQQEGGWRSGSDRFLFAPVQLRSRRQMVAVVVLCILCALGWSALINGRMGAAWTLPDVNFYELMARHHMEQVPRPFSARPLHPWLAAELSRGLGVSLHGGFLVMSLTCMAWTVGVVFWLLARRGVPGWLLLAVAVVPFWPDLQSFAALPDPLYSALIAALLVALECGWLTPAVLLIFPMMLARESTSLTLLCLLLVAGRRLGWVRSAVAVGLLLAASAIVSHLSRNGMPNPEQLGGGLYMAGKIVSNSLRSVGVVPWSNVYPELCRVPSWQMPVQLGRITGIGLCPWSPGTPALLLWTFLTSFGVLPLLLLSGRGRFRELWSGSGTMLRFCVVYGAISFLIGPALGTWYNRLVGYGWPLLLVAVPVLAARAPALRQEPAWLPGVLLVLHLVVCALGAGHVFASMGLLIAVEACAAALLLGETAARPRGGRAASFQVSA